MIDYKNPKYKPIFEKRVKLLNRIREDSKYLHASLLYYKSHRLEFIQDWFDTFDPRNEVLKYVPFILWEKQKEYLEWLDDLYENKEDGVVEKSRDAGATWLSIAWAVHRWRFESGFKCGFGSRKQDLVDKIGDPDSIFEKIRILLNRLPKEILPYGFNIDAHAQFLKIINPENGSTITGEAGDNIGRGGRSSIYFKDESAFYERPLKIESALSENSDCKIDISTHNGIGTLFYQKRFSGKYPVFIFDWTDDPRKDQQWYNKRKERLDPVILAQEIDRNPGASAENICIPADWVQSAMGLDIPYSGEKTAALDVADEGADLNVLTFRHGSKVLPLIIWKEGNTAQSTKKAYRFCIDKGFLKLKYDNIGVGAGVKGELSNEGYEDLESIGINTGSSPSHGWYTEDKLNKDMFKNLRAEIWWKLRRRFERTYEFVNGLNDHDPDELISIPNDLELAAELSTPKYKFTENGKILIEKKEDMRKRGIKSPNRADSVALAFAPDKKIDITNLIRRI